MPHLRDKMPYRVVIPERLLVDLKLEVTKVFEFFEAWAEEREVRLQFTGYTLKAVGAPLILRRVINNLLSNAIRYTPKKWL